MENLTGKTPDQKLVLEYLDKFKACQSQRQPFEKEWYTNLAMYFGRHYMQWLSSSPATGQAMILPRAAAWRVRLVSNRIKTIVRKENAKCNKERGQWFVRPATPDDEDLAKARMAEAVSEQLLINNAFDMRKREANWWRGVCGTGFMKVYYEKDVEFLSPSPFHIWVPNLEEIDIQKQDFVVHGIATTTQAVFDQYGVEVEADSTADNPESKFRQSLGIDKKGKELDHVFIKEFWVKSCRQFPDGAMFVISNDKLIYITEKPPEPQIDPATGQPLMGPDGQPIQMERPKSNVLAGGPVESVFPYEHGQYPFAKIDHIQTGRFYAESSIKDLIPVQKEYNRSRSQAIEARNLTSKPQWKVPMGSVDVKKLTAQPGLVVEYTPGFDPPERIIPPELPAYFMQDQQANLNDMDYISNQFEVTQGRTPPGVEAASAIAYLQEENDSILLDTISSLEECVERVGYQAIMLAKQFWSEEKLVQVMSGNQVYEVMQFKQGSLPDQVDFRVEHGSMAPRSRAAKQAFILELIDKQLIPPMEGLKYLEMSETARLYDELSIDTRQADRENFKMKNVQVPTAIPQEGMESPMGMIPGQEPQPLQNPVMVNSFDNHEAHIYCHTKFMKSQQYEQLDPQVQMLFEQHYQQHLLTLGQQFSDAGATGESGSGGDSAEPSSNGQQQQPEPAY